MSRPQSAVIQSYPFEARGTGNPVVTGASAVTAKQWRATRGGPLTVSITNVGDAAMIVTLAVGETSNGTFTATTAAANLAVVENVTLGRGETRAYALNLRAGKDTFLRLGATGNTQGVIQFNEANLLEPDRTEVTVGA